jgi:hypothetical protein
MATNTTPIDAAVMAAPIDASFGEHSFSEALRNALIVTRREVRDSFRDWRIMAPIFILTLVFPMLANGMTGLFTRFFESAGATPLLNNFLWRHSLARKSAGAWNRCSLHR